MASRKLEDLHPLVKLKVERFLEACKHDGIDVLITCTYRSAKEQEALYAQSREPLANVNKKRKIVGLSPITEIENKRKVTNAKAGQSMHEFKLAIDMVPIIAGKPVWDVKSPLWQKIGKHGKKVGLEWAGDWTKFKEYPHFQYITGLSLKELQEGKLPVS